MTMLSSNVYTGFVVLVSRSKGGPKVLNQMKRKVMQRMKMVWISTRYRRTTRENVKGAGLFMSGKKGDFSSNAVKSVKNSNGRFSSINTMMD